MKAVFRASILVLMLAVSVVAWRGDAAAEVVAVRLTNGIPDGLSGVMSWKPTIGSEWGMPASVFQSPEQGVLHSVATTMFAGTSAGYGSWTTQDWGLVTFNFHYWENEAAFFSSPSMGQLFINISEPSSVDWSVGTNHLGWPIHHFTFNVLDLEIPVAIGQNYVVAIQVQTTPLKAPGLPAHSVSPGGFGQQYDLYASLTHPARYLWEHGTSQPYLATEVRVLKETPPQVPNPSPAVCKRLLSANDPGMPIAIKKACRKAFASASVTAVKKCSMGQLGC